MNTHGDNNSHDDSNEEIDGMSESTNERWRAVAVEELRATRGELLEQAGGAVSMTVVGVLAVVGALHDWAGVPAAVWWVLVGLIGGEFLSATGRLFDLWRTGGAVLRCTVCGRVWGRPEEVAEHWSACQPSTDAARSGAGDRW